MPPSNPLPQSCGRFGVCTMIAIKDGVEPESECVRRAAKRGRVGLDQITELLVAAYETGDSEEKMAADILSS